MRLNSFAAVAALAIASTVHAQPAPTASKVVNVDEPPLCNAAGLAPAREQASGYAIPADKGGGTLAYVDKSRAECQVTIGKKVSEDYRRPTICPLGSGRIPVDGVFVCRTQKLG